ncbi:kinase-like domain-containing protein [Rhizophagus diaphanus]|nr:kinase-like domain-containing protein [Rhizophagus diaphanus] [Rhizophagus sp. MUCL 43196]
MEYADSGTLQEYLKKHFCNLTWYDKLNLALQLVSAISYLHDEGIVHRDLHSSSSILIHRNSIKLADFGLTKRIEESSNLPYVDPKVFGRRKDIDDQMQMQIYSLNEKVDIYNIGVILWEIFSGQLPSVNEPFNDFVNRIIQDLRKTNVPGDYIKICTECWDNDLDNRPAIYQIIDKLKTIVTRENYNSTSEREHEINQKSSTISNNPNLPEINFNMIVNEIVNLLNKSYEEINNQEILNYLKDHNIDLQKIYIWLLNNQNNSNSIILLGKFYYSGIGVKVDKQKSLEFIQRAADLGNNIAKYNLGNYYKCNKDYDKAFELFKKSAEGEYPEGIAQLGYCYFNGIGTNVDKQKAFELFQKAANLGNIFGTNNLGYCYQYGIGTSIDNHEAFELYQKAANLGSISGTNNLGYCYRYGIGTNIDKQKSLELYRKAANLCAIQGNKTINN